jgi:hypothetical protein
MSLKFLDNINLSSGQKLGIGISLVQCAVAAPILFHYQQQINQKSRSLELDVADKNNILATLDQPLTPKISNLIVYGPSAAYAYYESIWGLTLNDTTAKVTKLLMTHFGKKAAELFILSNTSNSSSSDSESSSTTVKVSLLTSTFYMIGTYLVVHNTLPLPMGMDIDYAQKIFWMGQFGESFHRYLLEAQAAKNRKQKELGQRSYSLLPTWGLFPWVAAPHLLFEIVTWIGIAGCARQANTYVQATVVAVILAVQAKKLNDDVNNNSPDNHDTEQGLTTARSDVDGVEPTKKRWNLIPYIY